MPIWLRKFHIQSINDFNEKQQADHKKAKGESTMGDNGNIFGPGVNPSSYNFSK